MLKNALNSLNLSITDQQVDLFEQYIELLSKWNKTYNLSAIREKELMYPYHLYDSLSIAPYVTKNHIIDVGSGAGLPGIPLAILFPNKQIKLLDSNIKKSRFQRQVMLELNLNNVEVIHKRVEAYQPSMQFDYVISRAFSSLKQMLSLCQHLLKADGEYLAMKGINPTDEIKALKAQTNLDIKTIKLNVPRLEASRHLLIIKPNKT
ncbi:16S rRNA (guanine(527)-N(7))-methyltransferase RsmG [Thiotrichales bacterium 19S3-7]|nr:16S rRNA (guanine(527)-N(7))-methyltransferase RsmG [Thiotrichales bacterium 19S3-7]MCF6800913.1 16S rRNA (guanine(527)-N(7))-methyltransferase RsmG [Thiotrichales bacterium 19S3-11]